LKKTLGVPELIALALGRMIGVFTPATIISGGLLATLAAYSYLTIGA